MLSAIEILTDQAVDRKSAAANDNVPEPKDLLLSVVVEQADLLQEIALAVAIVPAKVTVPVLASLLLHGDGERLSITATDLDISIGTSCGAQVRYSGYCTVPARKFYEYIRLLPSGPVSIALLDNGWVRIRSGRSVTKMISVSYENYPNVRLRSEGAPPIQLPAQHFKRLIERTAFAAGDDESRLNMAKLELSVTNQLRMIATDGRRLALATCPFEATQQGDADVSVPSSALKGLQKLIGERREMTYSSDASSLYFEVGHRTLAARRFSFRFPNWEFVIPKPGGTLVMLNTGSMRAALDRSLLFIDKQTGCVAVELSKDSLSLKSASADVGDTEEHLEIYGGPAAGSILAGFNGTYLRDALDRAGDEISMRLIDPQSAAVFECSFDDASSALYLVMPMRM